MDLTVSGKRRTDKRMGSASRGRVLLMQMAYLSSRMQDEAKREQTPVDRPYVCG
jgi:hypothetical protein